MSNPHNAPESGGEMEQGAPFGPGSRRSDQAASHLDPAGFDPLREGAHPEGFILMPMEPDEEMIAAGWRGFQGSGRGTTAIWHAYRAMVAERQRRAGK